MHLSTKALLAGLVFCGSAVGGARADQPNVILIMVDDMGFSDIAPYGSEINTPNLSALANQGVSYTQFYNTARCSTTRASLLSGQYSHNVGLGALPSTNYNFQNGGTMPGYSGWYAGTDPQAPDVAPTLPEVLKTAGYDTSMSGKWHLTRTATINSGPNGSWPVDRGFDKFYGTMEGAKDYFDPTWLVDSEAPGTFVDTNTLPADYFYTNAISSRGAQFIRDEVADGDSNPFFHYHAFYAPHFPLQAPATAQDAQGNNLVAKYQAVYAAGWDQIRSDRHMQQIALGLLEPGTVLPDKNQSDSGIPDWSTLSQTQKDDLILRMAVYAAQVEIMDQGVGTLMDAVRDPNGDGDTSDSIEDDTVVLFISDNGGQGGDWNGQGNVSNWDSAASATQVKYGTGWANLSNTPFTKFKSDTYEGGISSPLIVAGYGVDDGLEGSIDTESVGHIIDIMPTIMGLAGASYPANADASEIEGASLAGTFNGGAADLSDRELYFEHEGNRAARVGDWKLVVANGSSVDNTRGYTDFELYNIIDDRGETTNLANARPEIARELRQKWEAWAERNMAANRSQSNAGSPFLSNGEIDWVGQRRSNVDLVAHFDMEDGSYDADGNLTVSDISGHGFHGTLISNNNAELSQASGVQGLGNAINLANDTIDIDLRSDIALGDQARAFSVWFNADNTGNRRIFGYGDPTNNFGPGSMMLLTMVDQTSQTDAMMQLRMGLINLNFDPGDANAIGINEWVHTVLVVPEGATTTADIKMFINGQEVAGVVEGGGAHVDLVTGLSWFSIGRRGGTGPGGAQGNFYDFDGQIGDLQVYNAELSAGDAAYLFANPGNAVWQLGDLNSDALLTSADLGLLNDAIIAGDLSKDLNHDGVVDAGDINRWVVNFYGTVPADFDLDGDVDDADFGVAFAAFSGPGSATGNFAADLDNDGDVDDADFGLAFAAFTGPGSSPANVPEPASVALLGLGGLLLVRRR